jgi:hypothetical protein
MTGNVISEVIAVYVLSKAEKRVPYRELVRSREFVTL